MKIYFYSDQLSIIYEQSVVWIHYCYEKLIQVSATLTL